MIMTRRRPAQLRPAPAHRRPRRGVALMMVVAVVALASILGYTMLHTASLQNHAGTNQTKLLSADYLAESGLNIAMYYLQYPLEAPARNADGYWSGMNADYTLPNGSPATLTVSVTRAMDTSAPPQPIPWTYEIAASASVGSSSEPTRRVTRTTGARVYVRNEYVMRPGAVVANNNITFYGPIKTNGDVYSSKQIAIKSGSIDPEIRGAGYSDKGLLISGYIPPRDGYLPIHNPVALSPIAPSNGNVNLYKTYNVDGEQYSAGLIQSVTNILTGLLGLLFPAPSEDNPAGIIYKDATASPLVLEDNQTINGTLIVEGNLQVKGTNITINPKPGYPALIVTGNLEIFQSGKNLTVNGITYIGGQLKSNNNLLPAPPPELASTFVVNGGLIFGTTSVSPIPSNYNVRTTLNYDPTRAVAPELTPSAALRNATGVSIVRWGLP
jgi:Tfp pilus assembly protein PilX